METGCVLLEDPWSAGQVGFHIDLSKMKGYFLFNCSVFFISANAP